MDATTIGILFFLAFRNLIKKSLEMVLLILPKCWLRMWGKSKSGFGETLFSTLMKLFCSSFKQSRIKYKWS